MAVVVTVFDIPVTQSYGKVFFFLLTIENLINNCIKKFFFLQLIIFYLAAA